MLSCWKWKNIIINASSSLSDTEKPFPFFFLFFFIIEWTSNLFMFLMMQAPKHLVMEWKASPIRWYKNHPSLYAVWWINALVPFIPTVSLKEQHRQWGSALELRAWREDTYHRNLMLVKGTQSSLYISNHPMLCCLGTWQGLFSYKYIHDLFCFTHNLKNNREWFSEC